MLIRSRLAAAIAAVLLAACGGGGDGDQAPAVRYDKLVSFGDSLSDVGTHNVGTIAFLSTNTGGGGRWATNSTAGGEIWTERLAAQIGVAKPCAAETGLQPSAVLGLTGAPITAVAGCFSYAQGSARITSPLGPNSIALQAVAPPTLGLIAKPLAAQMAAHLTASGGSYSGNELVTVLAGANDVFMELNFIGTALGASTPDGAVVRVATAGATLGQLIRTQIVARGAKRVLVLNMPDVAGTPFAKTLDLARPGTAALIDAMVTAFNAQLAAQLQGVPEVRLADAYSVSKDQVANPAQYGLVNVTDVACGPNALSPSPTANGTSLVCNASNTLAGVDVSRYQFADDVHPTAYGHLLLTQFAAKELLQAGWL
jgi:outer membrane lipase/esterase